MPTQITNRGAQVGTINSLLQQAEQPLSTTEKRKLADQFYAVSKTVTPQEAARLTTAANNLYQQMATPTPARAGGAAGAQMVAAQFQTKPVSQYQIGEKMITLVGPYNFIRSNYFRS